MFRLFAGRVICEQGKSRELRLPDADPLVQRVEELLHRGGAVETHHLCEKPENCQWVRPRLGHFFPAELQTERVQ